MSTHRMYYDDAYLQNFDARVLACSPAEPVQGPSGMQPAWEVLLDQTAFIRRREGSRMTWDCWERRWFWMCVMKKVTSCTLWTAKWQPSEVEGLRQLAAAV